jgi:hypothetical protein
MADPRDTLKTPDEWQAEMPDLVVVDPDGWRGEGGRPWTDPISREEYIARRNLCTVLDAARQRDDGNRPGA